MFKAVGLITPHHPLSSSKPGTATINDFSEQFNQSRNVATAATTVNINVKKYRNFDMKMGDSPLQLPSRKR